MWWYVYCTVLVDPAMGRPGVRPHGPNIWGFFNLNAKLLALSPNPLIGSRSTRSLWSLWYILDPPLLTVCKC